MITDLQFAIMAQMSEQTPTRQPIEIGTGSFLDALDVIGMHHISAYISSLQFP